jgi:hypothetical protein
LYINIGNMLLYQSHVLPFKNIIEPDKKVCGICGVIFKPTRINQKHCSVACRIKQNGYLNSFKHRHICHCCGSEFYCSTTKQKYCSIKCYSKKSNEHLYSNGKKQCAMCKGWFDLSSFKIKKHNGTLRSYCTDCHKSKNNAKNYKRRAWNAEIKNDLNVFKVFSDCNWKCSYCGCDTPKELRGKMQNNSPELDHIIPLSKGGSHTYDNVTLSCRKCNLSKNNKLNYAKTGIRRTALSY